MNFRGRGRGRGIPCPRYSPNMNSKNCSWMQPNPEAYNQRRLIGTYNGTELKSEKTKLTAPLDLRYQLLLSMGLVYSSYLHGHLCLFTVVITELSMYTNFSIAKSEKILLQSVKSIQPVESKNSKWKNMRTVFRQSFRNTSALPYFIKRFYIKV